MINRIWSRFSRIDAITITLYAAAALIGISACKDLLFLLAGRDVEVSTFFSFLNLETRADSWNPIYDSIEHLRSGAEGGLYQTIFFERQTKFQYPPTSLLPFLAMSHVGVDREGMIELMRWISFASVLAIMVATARFSLHQLPAGQPTSDLQHRVTRALVCLGVAAGTFSYFPIMYGYELGQIQILIDLAVIVALTAWAHGSKVAAGALMAFAALIKPQYALVLVWSLLRREHDFTRGFLIAAVPVTLLSLVVFGLDEHLRYLSVLSYIGSRGEYSWPNQSINGLLNRLYVGDAGLKFDAHEFAPYNTVVYAGTVLTSLALIGFALAFRPRWVRSRSTAASTGTATARESLLDLSTMIVVLTIASPIAWDHHYGVTWPMIIASLFVLADVGPRISGRTTAKLCCGLLLSYVLISNYFTPLRAIADSPLNILQSYIFIGGLALLWTLAKLRAVLGSGELERRPDFAANRDRNPVAGI